MTEFEEAILAKLDKIEKEIATIKADNEFLKKWNKEISKNAINKDKRFEAEAKKTEESLAEINEYLNSVLTPRMMRLDMEIACENTMMKKEDLSRDLEIIYDKIEEVGEYVLNGGHKPRVVPKKSPHYNY